MREVGLTKVDFGLWIKKADNLKFLVDNYITPKPDYKQYKEIGSPLIIKRKAAVKQIILRHIDKKNDEYADRLLKAAIQNEQDMPNVALRQYEELANMGFF